jgi:TatD DNase family protein
MLIDTHAHIHFDDYNSNRQEVIDNAAKAGVDRMVCVGVDPQDSAKAIGLASKYHHIFATAGLHPHDASQGQPVLESLAVVARNSHKEQASKLVAIGECGLDFFKEYSSRRDQEAAFRFQIELATELNLPMVWHVRNAFDRFFQITAEYPRVRGIVHCFTGNRADMERAVARGFMVALNGIMTFTRDQPQLEAAKHLPLSHLVLETDCPFLTPAPRRGEVNEPANLKLIAEFLADLRGESFDALARQSSANAWQLLKLK